MNAAKALRIFLLALGSSLATAAAVDVPQPAKPAAAPAGKAAAAQQNRLARLRFAPEGEAWRGETPFEGASWHKLGPAPGGRADVLMMQGRAGVGDKFPVQSKEGVTLFEVFLAEGGDKQLGVEVRTKAAPQKVEIKRDKSAKVEVDGVKYTLSFPTISVEAQPGEDPSTNKATIMVTQYP
jgi:hypothetical protein